jgi:hypothetical protein
LAEAGVIIHDEFREGNIAPATQNLEFIKSCEACLPKGHVIANVRLDSAGYQSSIFNYLEDTGKTFAIGGRLDRPTQQGSDRALAFISFAGQAGTSCGCVGIEGSEISARVVSSYP